MFTGFRPRHSSCTHTKTHTPRLLLLLLRVYFHLAHLRLNSWGWLLLTAPNVMSRPALRTRGGKSLWNKYQSKAFQRRRQPALLTGSHLTLMQLRACLREGCSGRRLCELAMTSLSFYTQGGWRNRVPCQQGTNCIRNTHMHALGAVHLFCSLPRRQQQRQPRCKSLQRSWDWRNRRKAEVEISLADEYWKAFSIKSQIKSKNTHFKPCMYRLSTVSCLRLSSTLISENMCTQYNVSGDSN